MKKSLLFVMLTFQFNTLYANVIYKCKLPNGTLSYQKKPCIEDKSTILENIQKRQKAKANKNKPTSEQQIKSFLNDNLEDYVFEIKTHIITIFKLKNWRVFKKNLDEKYVHLKFLGDTKGSEISLLMDFLVPEESKTYSHEELNKTLLQLGQRMLESSIQDKVTSVTMNVRDGIGVKASFTDANLIGKNTFPAGEYLHTTAGLIFKNGVFIHFTLLSNDLKSMNHILAMQFLTGGINMLSLGKPENQTTNLDQDPLDKPYENFYNGNKRESVAMFEEVLDKQPDSFKAWIGYCLALRDTNRLQSAFIACDKALSLDIDNTDVYASLINLYSVARLWEQGMLFINNTITEFESEQLLNTINNFGYYAMQDENFAVATKAFQIVYENTKNKFKVEVDIATNKLLKGNSSEAILDVKALIKQHPENDNLKIILRVFESDNKTLTQYNELPYVIIPSRLQTLGIGANKSQQVDDWVTKIFPLKGVGKINIQVPESWYEHIQITATDSNNNNITLKLVDLKTLTIITFNIGKVGTQWNLASIKKQLTESVSIFFEKKDITLTQLKNNKGFKFTGTTTEDDGKGLKINAQHELNGILSVKSLVVANNHTALLDGKIKKILGSIKIMNYDSTPLKFDSDKLPVNIQSAEPANDTPLPVAPQGFKWVRMPKAMAAFVKPDGWFEKNKSTDDAFVYAISKESVDVNGSFETGLTVQALRKIKQRKGISPVELALEYYQGIVNSPDDTVITKKDISQGPFTSFFVRYENHPENLEPIIVHKVFTANEKTGSLYIVIFESPKDTWDQSWIIGNEMMKYYLVDDEF